jgi:hypothetical protein
MDRAIHRIAGLLDPSADGRAERFGIRARELRAAGNTELRLIDARHGQ